jgi:bud site selection protein 20
MGPCRPKKRNRVRDIKRSSKTKARGKDLDQIVSDAQLPSPAETFTGTLDTDLPGLGQVYCLPCARYFISPEAGAAHTRTKLHKRRLGSLKSEPYTIEESERAAGLGSQSSLKSDSTTAFYAAKKAAGFALQGLDMAAIAEPLLRGPEMALDEESPMTESPLA